MLYGTYEVVCPWGITIQLAVVVKHSYIRTHTHHSHTHTHTCTLHPNRWRLVVHGGVDGFSRIPVYLHCGNNRANTVLRLFKEAISTYGLPSPTRCDQGGENVDVSMFLLTHPLRGPGRGTVIVGKSVHNQRIERM